MLSPNRLVQIVIKLNSLPKRIFSLAIANARILENIQHTQAHLTLLIRGKILTLLGARRQSRRHKEKNLPFRGVLDRAGKNSKSGGPRAAAKTSATITSPFPAALDPSFANWLQKDRYCAVGGRNNGPIGDALRATSDGRAGREPLKKALPQHVSPTKHLKFWRANHIQSFMRFHTRLHGSGFWLLLCHVSSYFVI
jgi:hypothetical protein